MSLFGLLCSTEFTPFCGLRKERMEKQIDDTRAREKSQRDSQREMQVLCQPGAQEPSTSQCVDFWEG